MSIVPISINTLHKWTFEDIDTIIEKSIEFSFSSISGRRYKVVNNKVFVLIEPLGHIKYPGYHRPKWKESTMYTSVAKLKLEMIKHVKE